MIWKVLNREIEVNIAFNKTFVALLGKNNNNVMLLGLIILESLDSKNSW